MNYKLAIKYQQNNSIIKVFILLYYIDFVYFSDLGLAQSYGLQIGNYLHIKNIHTQNL